MPPTPRWPGRGLAILAAASLSTLTATAWGQTDGTYSGLRALNLARNHAVKLNGGLGIYRPAACMFSTGQGGTECLVRSDADGFLYRFLGGPPGWEQLGKPANRETEILIAPDGRSVVAVPYNGAPRLQGQSPPAPAPATGTFPAPAQESPPASEEAIPEIPEPPSP